MKHKIRNLWERLAITKTERCRNYFYSQTDMTYFWGHKLTEIYQHDVFSKLPRYTESLGFCYIASALSMFALRYNTTATLVHADIYDNDQQYNHSWVEFFHQNTYWVVDYTWLRASQNPMRRSRYLKQFIACPNWECDYYDFWEHSTTKILRKFLMAPESSHIFGELYAYSGIGVQKLNDPETANFNSETYERIMRPDHGTIRPGHYPFYIIPDGNELRPICKTAIDGLIKGACLSNNDIAKIERVMIKKGHGSPLNEITA